MFAVDQRLTPLLGQSYRENEYSPAFHKMVEKVASKIYQKKGMRRRLFLTKIYEIPDQQQQLNTPNNRKFQQLCKKSLSQVISNDTPCNLKGLQLKKIAQKQRQLYQKNQKYSMPNQTDPKNRRYQNETQNTYSMNFYQKIQKYDRYLVIRTFRFQDESKQIADKKYSSIRKQKYPQISPYLRKKPLNIMNRQIRSGPKAFNQATRSVSLPINFKNDFKPWSTKQADQFIF